MFRACFLASLFLHWVSKTVADLPVHCLHSDVLGTWKFRLGTATKEKGHSCGHEQPDKVMTMPNAGIGFNHPDFPVEREISITLADPDRATDADGNEGTWTLVYDEGIDVHIAGQTFFTFFRYVPLRKTFDQTKVSDFRSYCDETVSGWRTTATGEHNCFVASKIESKTRAPVLDTGRKSLCSRALRARTPLVLRPHEPGCSRDSVGERFMTTRARVEATQRHTRMTRSQGMLGEATFHADTAFIHHINSNQASTWTAKAHGHFEGKTMTEILSMLGKRHFRQIQRQNHRNPTGTHTSVDLHSHGFPSVFDWRKIDGGVYMTPVTDQASCGSCYAVSTADVASMRYRIKYGKDNKDALKTRFSAQNVVGCSRTNQGCDGGYPYLVGKHGVDMGFVPYACQPYTGDNECKISCLGDAAVVHAKSYEYVGGYYGAGNELDMLRALKRGPIVVAVNAPPDLLYFSHGIYSHPLEHDSEEYVLNGISRWEKTNHAIVCVGWGEELVNGQNIKYWIIKNSWGQQWGDDGFFYVRRGEDSMAIESMAVEISF